MVNISKELESERYHDAKRIDVRKDNILRLWDYLQELLKARRGRLDKNLTLQRIFQEMLHIISWMDDMKVAAPAASGLAQRLVVFPTLNSFASFFRLGLCLLTLGNTCWKWKTCCRNTLSWRTTSRCRRRESRTPVLRRSSLPMETVSAEADERAVPVPPQCEKNNNSLPQMWKGFV